MNKDLLAAKYNKAHEIGCDGCGGTWVATDEGFTQAALSLEEGNGCECIACNDDLEDKYINNPTSEEADETDVLAEDQKSKWTWLKNYKLKYGHSISYSEGFADGYLEIDNKETDIEYKMGYDRGDENK